MRSIRKIATWQRLGLALLVGILAVGIAAACGGEDPTATHQAAATQAPAMEELSGEIEIGSASRPRRRR